MRLLTREEMDLVFGGDAPYAGTTPTVEVTANFVNTDYTLVTADLFSDGSSGGGESIGINVGCSGGGNNGSHNQIYLALPATSFPNLAHLECQVNRSAVSGFGLNSAFKIAIIDQFGFSPTNGNVQTGGLGTSTCTGQAPTNFDSNRPLYGLTTSTPSVHLTSLFAGAFSNPPGSIQYLNPGDNNLAHLQTFTPPNGTAFGADWPVGVLAHEATHEDGNFNTKSAIDELHAWYYGVQAMLNFDHGKANGCP